MADKEQDGNWDGTHVWQLWTSFGAMRSADVPGDHFSKNHSSPAKQLEKHVR